MQIEFDLVEHSNVIVCAAINFPFSFERWVSWNFLVSRSIFFVSFASKDLLYPDIRLSGCFKSWYFCEKSDLFGVSSSSQLRRSSNNTYIRTSVFERMHKVQGFRWYYLYQMAFVPISSEDEESSSSEEESSSSEESQSSQESSSSGDSTNSEKSSSSEELNSSEESETPWKISSWDFNSQFTL